MADRARRVVLFVGAGRLLTAAEAAFSAVAGRLGCRGPAPPRDLAAMAAADFGVG